MTDGPVRTVFLGSGGFGEPSLRRLASHPLVTLVGVVTAPPRPAGRGHRQRSTAIHDTASTLGLGPVFTPHRLRDPASMAEIVARDPELLVLADYGQLVPPALLDVRRGALNLHPSLLPRHRGATPVQAAILSGDQATGVTLMRMDAGLDTGPIVAQVRVPLRGDETTPDLEATLAARAAALLDQQIAPWLDGTATAAPQPTEGATLTRPLRREDGRLDPSRPAAELERQVRAYQPWPGSFADTDGVRFTVLAAEVAPSGPTAGTIDASGIGTADGTLAPTVVRPAGGRDMTWAAFLRGRPSVVGSSVALASGGDG